MKSAAPPDLPASADLPVKQSPLARLFRAFSYRDFRLQWSGAFTSSIGTWVQQTAMNWLVLDLTGDPFYLGLNEFLGTAPFLVFSLFGGVVADRVDRRKILLTSQFLQLTFAFALAALAWSGVISVWYILPISLLTGIVQSFGGPAYQALVPTLVEKKDLPNAIALNSIQFNLARVVGPVIGGAAFRVIGGTTMHAAALCFGLNGLSFGAVIATLLMLSVRQIPRTGGSNMQSDMRGGLSFVWRNEVLLSLTLLAFFASFFGFQPAVFLPVFAKDVFRVGVSGYSSLLTVSGAGAVTGALIAAWLGDIKNKGRKALIMLALFGVVMIIYASTTSIWLAYPLVFLNGMSMLAIFAMMNSLVQLLVTDEMRGRVVSIYMLAFRGGMPLGSLATGKLLEYYKPGHVLAVEGALLTLITLAFFITRPPLRNQ
ncbi:MAG: MFS transporter [Blastocatellia bacterium]